MIDVPAILRSGRRILAREKLRSPERVQTGRAIRPGGEGGGLGYPLERILLEETPLQMSKAAHCQRWLTIENLLAYYPDGVEITLPPSSEMAIGDPYWLSCLSDSASGRCTVSLFPNTDQTIIMPSEDVTYASGKYVRMGALYENVYGHYQLILVCCAAATWIAWAASTSIIEGP